jgi:hypothetical protein
MDFLFGELQTQLSWTCISISLPKNQTGLGWMASEDKSSKYFSYFPFSQWGAFKCNTSP